MYWWFGSEVDTLDTSQLMREMSFGSLSDRTQDLPVFHRAVYDHSNALKVARNIPTYEGSDFPKSVREDSVLPGFEPRSSMGYNFKSNPKLGLTHTVMTVWRESFRRQRDNEKRVIP